MLCSAGLTALIARVSVLPLCPTERGRGFEQPVTREFTPAQCPRASPSPQREHSPVLFTQPDRCPSMAVSDMISFGVSDNELDDSLSLAASDAEELSRSVTDRPLAVIRTSLPAHGYRMEGRGDSSVQAVLSHNCIRWTRLLGGWTSSFSASLNGCAPGLPGQDALQRGSRSGFSLTQGPASPLGSEPRS